MATVPRWQRIEIVRQGDVIQILHAPRWIALTPDLLDLMDPAVAHVDDDDLLVFTGANRTVRYQRLGEISLGSHGTAIEFERADPDPFNERVDIREAGLLVEQSGRWFGNADDRPVS